MQSKEIENKTTIGNKGDKAYSLIDLVKQSSHFFLSKTNEPYAAVSNGEYSKICSIDSYEFRCHVVSIAYKNTGKIPDAKDIASVIDNVRWIPVIANLQRHDVFVRYGMIGNTIYIDLANAEYEHVEITENGWEIKKRGLAPPYFIRYQGMQPLPHPQKGGSIEDIIPFINIRSKNSLILIIGWLIGAMYPHGPFSMLIQQGAHGSAKSTMLKIMCSIIDPSEAGLTALPKSGRDLFISAIHTWLLSFDNVSKLKREMSDNFCRLTNDGTIRTRMLYTDSREVLLKAKRPAIFNGISQFAQENDFIDRAIFIDLPTIKSADRKPEHEIWDAWNETRPKILGALYDILVVALRNYNQVKAENLPRTADFAQWVIAAEPACPWEPGAFLEAYERNRNEMIEQALEADPAGESILKLMEDKTDWAGSSSELLEALKLVTSKDNQKLKEWPKAPNALSNRLMRLEGFLSSKGVKISRERQPNKRLIKLHKVSAEANEGENPINMRVRGDYSPVTVKATTSKGLIGEEEFVLTETDLEEGFPEVEPVPVIELSETGAIEEVEV